MRKQHRRLPTLECLDDRIVPSVLGGASAAMVSGTTSAEHALVISKDAHAAAEAAAHAKAKDKIGDMHHEKLHHAVKKIHVLVTPAASTQSSAQTQTGGTMAAAAAAAPAASAQVNAQASIAATTPASSATSASAGGSATLTATPAITVNTSASAPAATTTSTTSTATAAATTTTNPGDIENGPLAKAGQDLVNIYEEYEQQLGSSAPTFPQASVIHIKGTDVGVDIRSSGGDFNAFVSAMTALGMQVQSQSAAYATVEGYLPIAQLVAAAENAQTLSISPMYIGIPG